MTNRENPHTNEQRLRDRISSLQDAITATRSEPDDQRMRNRCKELVGQTVLFAPLVTCPEWTWLNQATGTLTKVHGTTASVDFGDVGKEHGSQVLMIPTSRIVPVRRSDADRSE